MTDNMENYDLSIIIDYLHDKGNIELSMIDNKYYDCHELRAIYMLIYFPSCGENTFTLNI